MGNGAVNLILLLTIMPDAIVRDAPFGFNVKYFPDLEIENNPLPICETDSRQGIIESWRALSSNFQTPLAETGAVSFWPTLRTPIMPSTGSATKTT